MRTRFIYINYNFRWKGNAHCSLLLDVCLVTSVTAGYLACCVYDLVFLTVFLLTAATFMVYITILHCSFEFDTIDRPITYFIDY